MGTVSAAEQAASVPGELHYLERGSTVLRRFTAPGASINTGSYEAHTVPIRNGRPVQDTFRTDMHGFEIVSHRSAVHEFTDKAEVDAAYIPEVIQFVKERTGADEVVRAARCSAARHLRPSTRRSHRPHSSTSTTARRVLAMTAPRVYAEHFPDGPGYRRALAASVWRVFSPPPQDWPLAVCDFRSLSDDEGLPNQLYLTPLPPPSATVPMSRKLALRVFGSAGGLPDEPFACEFRERSGARCRSRGPGSGLRACVGGDSRAAARCAGRRVGSVEPRRPQS